MIYIRLFNDMKGVVCKIFCVWKLSQKVVFCALSKKDIIKDKIYEQLEDLINFYVLNHTKSGLRT